MTRLESLAVEMAQQKRVWREAVARKPFDWHSGGQANARVHQLTDEIAAEGERLIRERESHAAEHRKAHERENLSRAFRGYPPLPYVADAESDEPQGVPV